MTSSTPLNDAWSRRVDDLWRRAAHLAGDQLLAEIDALAAERPDGDPRALFERACARDTAGLEAEAEPLYRAALATGGLDPYRQTRAVIQLGSTLRWLGRLAESEALLKGELDHHMQPGNDRPLHDEARALLALTYAAQGRGHEAAGLTLAALAPKLSRYQRSTLACARTLAGEVWEDGTGPRAAAAISMTEGRFLLRPFTPDDIPEFAAAVRESQAVIGRWMKWAHPGFSSEDAAAWIDRCLQGWRSGTSYEFGLFDGETGALVGSTGLNSIHAVHPFCNLGYWVRRSRHGEGAASAGVRAVSRYAFERLGLHRVEIVVAEGNEASLAVARRCGAHYEGLLRNRIIGVDGAPWDGHMFSLTPERRD